MRLKVTVSDTNRLSAVKDAETGRFLEGVTRIGFDSSLGARSKLILEISAPCFELEFVKDERVRKIYFVRSEAPDGIHKHD